MKISSDIWNSWLESFQISDFYRKFGRYLSISPSARGLAIKETRGWFSGRHPLRRGFFVRSTSPGTAPSPPSRSGSFGKQFHLLSSRIRPSIILTWQVECSFAVTKNNIPVKPSKIIKEMEFSCRGKKKKALILKKRNGKFCGILWRKRRLPGPNKGLSLARRFPSSKTLSLPCKGCKWFSTLWCASRFARAVGRERLAWNVFNFVSFFLIVKYLPFFFHLNENSSRSLWESERGFINVLLFIGE